MRAAIVALSLVSAFAYGCLGELVILEGALACRPGELFCEGECINPSSDPTNCGGCGQLCAGVCVAGTCASSCEPPRTLCAGACVELDRDPDHCGECFDACDADELCIAAECQGFALGECDSCPCDCDGRICCESSAATTALCVDGDACPP